MSYHELKERFENLQDCNYRGVMAELSDLAEELLFKLQSSERALYLLKKNVPYEISSYYPRITKDPTISCFKDGILVHSQTLENPDFTKLHELGLYALSDGDYCIRTTQQLSYIFKFLRGEWKIRGCYYINFD